MSFKIPNIAVKCSRSLFPFCYVILKLVISLCCTFASQGISRENSLCFTDVKTANTSQETRNFFRADFLFVF